jgi:hypothetical protein
MLAGDNGGDIHLLKLNQNLEILWHKTWGSDQPEHADNIIETKDGGYITAGSAFVSWPPNSGLGMDFPLIVKFDSEGEFMWDKIMYNEYAGGFYSINQNADGGYIVGGQQKDEEAFDHLYLVRLLGSGNPVEEDNAISSNLSISPNPATDDITINYIVSNPGFVSLKIVDIFGRNVMLLKNSYDIAGSHFIVINSNELQTGTYYCCYQENDCKVMKKVSIVK